MSDEKTAKRRVTLRDVAQAAGVSLKTASNVINGSGRMTDETRAKVVGSSDHESTPFT